MNSLLILGGSSLGITISEIAKRSGRFNIEGFLDDQPDLLPLQSRNLFKGRISDLSTQRVKDKHLFVAIGNNRSRRGVYTYLESLGLEGQLISIIDPSATLLGKVSIDNGTIIFPGAVIGPGTRIGRCVVVNANSFIGPSCNVGSFSNICPGACIGSSTRIGDGVYVGMKSSIIQNLDIASDVVIGTGSAVISSIKDRGTFVGAPARPLSE